MFDPMILIIWVKSSKPVACHIAFAIMLIYFLDILDDDRYVMRSCHMVIQCNTANEFISQLSLSNEQWWDDNHECHWIFRGQNTNAELSPSLYRQSGRAGQLVYQNAFQLISNSIINGVPMDNVINNIVGGTNLNQDQTLIEIIIRDRQQQYRQDNRSKKFCIVVK